ncbi:flagellar basal body-associated FliL family protein [Luteibacter aegosomatissinici]|uniref:flagellar basal body-associated FliL family protein n=1 Tax=Luteibacter aegosomatissinici TaxID=2911539 RepID=UPI001FFB135A|nr:flagellar basal body-associated FliL family protein [Luteibacter aegosomatissinici]UPG93483.1 flagellar basal body-associated FliL family protein [Luteibacter aegosomatissinici]
MATAKKEGEVVKKKGKGKLLIIVALLVLAAGGGGAFFMLKGGHPKSAEQAAADAAKAKPAVYLQLDPAFVVNFQDEAALRFLQVGVNVMSHDPEAIAAAKEADPEIRNALLMLFSAQDVKSLSDVKGKQKLQAAALAEVQRVLKEKIGRPGVDALYFTSFIMQ